MKKKDNKPTTIMIDYETWRKLQSIKLDHGFLTMNDVILYLIDGGKKK